MYSRAFIDFDQLDLQDLIHYIKEKEHAYYRQMMPLIQKHLVDVTIEKTKISLGFRAVSDGFSQICPLLDQHLRKEDDILFPYILGQLEGKENDTYNEKLIPLIESPIQLLQKEHTAIDKLLAKINKISHNFYTPDSAAPTYKLAYQELREFEKKLARTIKMEDEILFPKILHWDKIKTKT
jgi:regulator of cell morphogenesis and NO signaling